MAFKLYILFFCLIIFPLIVINFKVSWALMKSKALNVKSKQLKLLILTWFLPFYGSYLVAKIIQIDWGKPKYDSSGGSATFGDWGGDG